jgi:hypothetical protein
MSGGPEDANRENQTEMKQQRTKRKTPVISFCPPDVFGSTIIGQAASFFLHLVFLPCPQFL